MKNSFKTKQALVEELASLRRRIRELELLLEHKRDEQTLLESEERYRNAFERHAAVKLLIDPDTGSIIEANEAAVNYYGWSYEQLKQMKIQDINTLPPEDVKKEMEKARTLKRIRFEFRHRLADGSIRDVEVFSSNVGAKGKDLLYSIIHDITGSKRAEEALRKSEILYRTFFDASNDMVFLKDEKGRYSIVNKGYLEYLGKKEEDVIGKTGFEFRPLQIAEQCDQSDRETLKFNDIVVSEETVNDRTIETRKFPVRLGGNKIGIGGFMRDITENKLAAKRLLESEERYRDLFENAAEGIYQSTFDGRLITVNPAFAKMLGFDSPDEAIATLTDIQHQVYVNPEDRERMKQIVGQYGSVSGFETQFYRKDGTKIWGRFSVRCVRDTRGILQYYEGILEDVTERKHDEEMLQASEELKSSILDTIPHAVIGLRERTIIFANNAVETVFGWKPEELIGKNTRALYRTEEEYRKIGKNFYPVLESQKTYSEDFPCRHRDGRDILCRVSATRIGQTLEKKQVVVMYEDITGYKKAEEELRVSEEKYRSIFNNAVEGIFQTTLEGQLLNANPALARMFGYDSPEEMIKKITNIGKQLYVNPEDRVTYKKIIEDEGVIHGFETQNYRKDGSIIWVSTNARAVQDTTGKTLHYEGTIEDITDRKHSEEELKASAEKLRKSLVGTIHALSVTVETRDPYTAGHQKKVSNLARTIAQEMDLPRDTVDIIRMAGTIHDIGKISVPAEILSKPTKLTAIEFSLIKVHPQSGYDILKDVDLPYPVAEIVYQHHERLDGSGYPRGLKDGQILLEACILAVADVVEAMASHRPYRPAKGIDMALEEIEANKGIFYDIRAVDACVRLFREKGFVFETTAS